MGELITGIFFCLRVDGIINGKAYKRGEGGGAYNRDFAVFLLTKLKMA